MKLSLYKNQFDVHPQTLDAESWDALCLSLIERQFPITTDKTNFAHISLSTFKGYKNGEHADTMSGLILDYDDGMLLEDAIDRFSEYEYLLYTSYNHQRVKTEGVAPVDKFRIIIPFVMPVTFEEWSGINDHVETLAPKVDPASKKFVQCFAFPCSHPDNQDNMMMMRNKGSFLDWRLFEKNKDTYTPNAGTAQVKYASDNVLMPDDIIRIKGGGSVRVEDVDKRYQCYCPFHNDKNPGAFISRSEKMNVFLHCNKCGTAFMKNDHANDPDVLYLKHFMDRRKESSGTSPIEAISEELLEFDEEVDVEYVTPYDRRKRAQIIDKKCVQTINSWDVLLMYAFEGFGKSYLATLMVKEGKKVVFASFSNEQVVEQAAGFTKQGLKVQVITGRSYKLGLHGITPEYQSGSHPWSSEEIAKDKTIKKIADEKKISVEEATELWDTCSPEKPNFIDYDIICTTSHRVNVWGRTQATKINISFKTNQPSFKNEDDRIVPKGTVIFFDDPNLQMLGSLHKYDEKWEGRKIDGVDIEQTTINNGRYFVKPIRLYLNYGLIDTKMVFTTTELIKRELIVKEFSRLGERFYQPKLMPDEKMFAGNITMIKAEAVRSKQDGIIPIIAHRLGKEGYDFTLIGDGMALDVNLISSQGQNIYTDKDIVIESSYPSYSEVYYIRDELELTPSDDAFIRLIVMLDKLQQAIGRNSGYRWYDTLSEQRKNCIVLCEPQAYKRLIKMMRYHVELVVSDCEKNVRRKKDYDNVIDGWCWFLTYVNIYIRSGLENDSNAFLNDVRQYLKHLPSYRRREFGKRLKSALIHKLKNCADQKLYHRITSVVGYIETSGL